MSDLEAKGLPYTPDSQSAVPPTTADSQSIDEKELPLHTTGAHGNGSQKRSRTAWNRVFTDEDGVKKHNSTVRAMASRHLMMIAIGGKCFHLPYQYYELKRSSLGTIGTGLFLSAGSVCSPFRCCFACLKLTTFLGNCVGWPWQRAVELLCSGNIRLLGRHIIVNPPFVFL